MDVKVEAGAAQDEQKAKATFSELCKAISDSIDRENNHHQIFMRYVDSILYDIAIDRNKGKSEQEVIAKSLMDCFSELKDMVQKAVTNILNEDSDFKKKFKEEWLPQLREIIRDSLRLFLKDQNEYKDRNEEEWLTPLLDFLTYKESLVEKVQILPLERKSVDKQESSKHDKMAPPLSPKETMPSPTKPEERRRTVSFDLQESSPQKGKSVPTLSGTRFFPAGSNADIKTTASAQPRRVVANSDEDRKKPGRQKPAVKLYAGVPHNSPAIAARGKGKTPTPAASAPAPALEPGKRTRKASLPIRLIERIRKKTDEDDRPDSAAGSSKSI